MLFIVEPADISPLPVANHSGLTPRILAAFIKLTPLIVWLGPLTQVVTVPELTPQPFQRSVLDLPEILRASFTLS